MSDASIFKESIYNVLQNPTRENLLDIFDNSFGEQDNLDFKEIWIDMQKLSEITLGIANSGGGAVIIGVKENDDGTLDPIGLAELEGKEKIHSKLNKFLPDALRSNVYDFDFTGESYSKIKGKLFQILIINSNDADLPYIWKKDSNGVESGCIFFRRGTKTVRANIQEIEDMLDKRFEANYIEQSNLQLEEHLKQLNTLYRNINSNGFSPSLYDNLFRNIYKIHTGNNQINPNYPKESYDEFIAKMIASKKKKIEKVLDLK